MTRCEWQPIETAPKDGTSVLIHNAIAPGLPGGVSQECWAGNTCVAAWWASSGNGKWICYMDAVEDPQAHFEPTHWMPLPSPPLSRKEASE